MLSRVKIVRAGWASSVVSRYAGALIALFAAFAWLGVISGEHSAGCVRRAGRCSSSRSPRRSRWLMRSGQARSLAGLFAFVAVGLFARDGRGLLLLVRLAARATSRSTASTGATSASSCSTSSPRSSPSASSTFRSSCSSLAGLGWYFVTDLVSSGGNWSATVTLLVGLALFFTRAGSRRRRPAAVRVLGARRRRVDVRRGAALLVALERRRVGRDHHRRPRLHPRRCGDPAIELRGARRRRARARDRALLARARRSASSSCASAADDRGRARSPTSAWGSSSCSSAWCSGAATRTPPRRSELMCRRSTSPRSRGRRPRSTSCSSSGPTRPSTTGSTKATPPAGRRTMPRSCGPAGMTPRTIRVDVRA